MLKENLKIQLEQDRKNLGRNYSERIKPIFDPKKSINPSKEISSNSSSNCVTGRSSALRKKSGCPHYNDYYSKFFEETYELSKNFDKHNDLSYVRTPTLQVNAKVDEVKSWLAANERENQARAIEYQRNLDHFNAEKEGLNFLSKQIKEKNEEIKNIKLEEKYFAQQLDERKIFMEKFAIDERERQRRIQHAYSLALNEQISHKNNESLYIKKLENDAKKILTPEPMDYGKNSPYNYPSSESPSLSPQRSQLKHLAQYGNFIIVRGRK